mgnify:CR=1 FL=1
MVTAIIPARGGSKGIKNKNVVDFLGKPLISYTVEQALEIDSIDNVYVSTDSERIAKVSREYGAEVIERPEELATDTATTESALLHSLEYLREVEGIDPDILVLLQCTCPLRRREDLKEPIRKVSEDKYDSVLSVCEDHKFYWRKGSDTAEPVNYEPENRPMRQEVETKYFENGSIYVFRTEILEENECRLGGKIGIHEMPKHLSFDIDTPEDLEIITQVGKKYEFFCKD